MVENYANIRAILYELHGALQRLLADGTTYTIFLGSTGLSEEEQVELLETLGRGKITINYTETDQPVEWFESSFYGIWIGTYRNAREDAIAYTIEVTKYPEVVGSQPEDMVGSAEELLTWAEAAGI